MTTPHSPQITGPQATASRHPRGFTLVELLVVITIIGMLMALLIPAVGAARARARNAQCQQNLKQIGTGMINYATSKQKFPGYVQPLQRNDRSYLRVIVNTLSNSTLGSAPENTPRNSLISWAAVIQPQLDRGDLYDMMLDGNVVAGDDRSKIVPQGLLICPADTALTVLPDAAGMTYSVNSGAWDYTGTTSPDTYLDPKDSPPNVDTGDTKDNGLCHNLTLGKVTNRPGKIKDGADFTVMLSENIHKEIEDPYYTWMGVGGDAASNTLQLAEQVFGMVWVVNAQPTSTNVQAPFSQEDPNGGAQLYSPNTPYYARPASNHPGGTFNVVMVGGSSRTLSPDLDYVVYQQLMTPEGRECVDPTDHSNTGGAIDAFRRAAPISSDSF